MDTFVETMPKAELHVHFDGTLEPEQFLTFAERNKISLPYTTLEEVYALYAVKDKEEFFKRFDEITTVLRTEEDFYELVLAYLKKASQQGVIYAEISFDTQSYVARGIKPMYVIKGVEEALKRGKKDYGIMSSLILCFLRNLSEQSAFKALKSVEPYREAIIGVGLACSEIGNPPTKFIHVFKQARLLGYHVTAHAGEESGHRALKQALECLHLERIDHGVRCWEDMGLVRYLVKRQLPLTVCPLSNVALKVYPSLKEHPIKDMLKMGLLVSIHSDDPAYFGYIADNFKAVAKVLQFSKEELVQCARNSFISSFLDVAKKQECITLLDTYVKNYNSFPH